MERAGLLIILLIFIISCKKAEFRVKIAPEKPIQGNEAILKLSQKFSGYFWWLEFSGGDPYKKIPHIEEIKGEKEIKIVPEDKNTSLILFAFEDKEGNLKIDSTYYVIYWTEEGKPAPYALSMLGFFYFSKYAPFENLRKFSSLWLQENEYYESHYDFMDNKHYFAIQTGAETPEEVKREIEEKLEEEKNNPSFLHTSYLTAKWVLNDTILANKIFKYFEDLPEDNYKISAYISYLEDKGIDKVASYLKEKEIDYFIEEFRRIAILKFFYPVLEEYEKFMEYIKQREKEGLLLLLDMGNYEISLFNKKEFEKLKEILKIEKSIIEDPIKIRKHYAFLSFPKKIKNVKEEIKSRKNDFYLALSSYYLHTDKPDSSYFYAKKTIEGKDFTELDPMILETLGKSALKSGHLEEAKKAYAYLVYYFGDSEFEDTLKNIMGESFEKESEKLKKEILPKLKTAPDFEVSLIDGSKFKYSENKGKVIVLNFWATWCGPCKLEIPELNELVEKFKDNKDVILLAITNEDKSRVKDFLKKQEFKYKIGIEGEDVIREFKVTAYPTHFIIDRKGKIVFKQIGYLKGTGEKLKIKIEKILKQS